MPVRTEKLRAKKDALMREACEHSDIRDRIARKIRHLERKKGSKEVLRILKRDLEALKKKREKQNEQLLHLGKLISQEGRGKRQ